MHGGYRFLETEPRVNYIDINHSMTFGYGKNHTNTVESLNSFMEWQLSSTYKNCVKNEDDLDLFVAEMVSL